MNRDEVADERAGSERLGLLVWKARDGLKGFRGGAECERPEVGEEGVGPDVDAAMGSALAPTLPRNLKPLKVSPSTRPSAGLVCLRERTNSVPAP